MFTKRAIERLTGAGLLVLVAAVAVAVATGPSEIDFSRDAFRETLVEIDGDRALWFTSAGFAIFANLVSIALAAAWYLTFSAYDRSLAVFGSFGFLAAATLELVRLTPNPPKDTDGRREDSGRGWVRELQGRWPGVLG